MLFRSKEGLEYHFEYSQYGNTFDARRLIHFAKTKGLQGEMKERLMKAYFTEGEAISDIDTRRLTRLLRDQGAQSGCIIAGADINEQAAIAAARAFPGLKGADLARAVTTTRAYKWSDGTWRPRTRGAEGGGSRPSREYRVTAFDYGIKRNILRILVDAGCRLTVVPAQTPAREVLREKPDGVFLSNGPGDPDPCDYAIEAIREILPTRTPVFGICLGHQLLGLLHRQMTTPPATQLIQRRTLRRQTQRAAM